MESPRRSPFVPQKRKINDVHSSDEEEDTHSFAGFRGFKKAASRSPSPPSEGRGGLNSGLGSGMGSRSQSPWNNNILGAAPKGRGAGGGARGGSSAGGNSFAARMMAKMGYKEGQGLGTSGQGILNPIETKLRPQGIGLGAVKEMTQQAKEERKRDAERKGEVLEDSSDEERKRRQKRKQERRSHTGSGVSTPTRKGPARPKYRTGREIEEDAAGLEVPNVLKSLIDATGKDQKLLTSTAGLMTAPDFVSANEGEASKIARRARNDLEAFADEWKGLAERKKYIELEEAQVMEEMDTTQSRMDQLAALTAAVNALERISLEENLQSRWEETTTKLEALYTDYRGVFDDYHLSDVTVAAVHPLLRESVEEWDPLTDPVYLTSYFRRIQPLVKQNSTDEDGAPRKRVSSTPYETMLYTIWLPRIRSSLNNEWDVHDPAPGTALIEAWKDILPPFIYANVIDQLIVPKLSAAIKAWKLRSSSRRQNSSAQKHSEFPWWLFTWLQFLDERHTNPKNPTGLMSDTKRKFRTLLDSWDISKGLIGGADLWKAALGSEFDNALQNHLLPRLARHLREEFDVNPQDQDLTALEDVLRWRDFFKPKVMALLLAAEFFPKWHGILHLWLTSEPNYEEVGQWFTWWKSQIPEAINAVGVVDAEWNKGLEMMNLALDLGERAKSELPAPASTSTAAHDRLSKPQQAADGKSTAAAPPKPKPKPVVQEATFKDVVEEWCADEGLIMLPLREAHVQTGLPLFRITASANGKGGCLVYLKGDVVWAQNRKSRELWEPVGLDASLVARAEGR